MNLCGDIFCTTTDDLYNIPRTRSLDSHQRFAPINALFSRCSTSLPLMLLFSRYLTAAMQLGHRTSPKTLGWKRNIMPGGKKHDKYHLHKQIVYIRKNNIGRSAYARVRYI